MDFSKIRSTPQSAHVPAAHFHFTNFAFRVTSNSKFRPRLGWGTGRQAVLAENCSGRPLIMNCSKYGFEGEVWFSSVALVSRCVGLWQLSNWRFKSLPWRYTDQNPFAKLSIVVFFSSTQDCGVGSHTHEHRLSLNTDLHMVACGWVARRVLYSMESRNFMNFAFTVVASYILGSCCFSAPLILTKFHWFVSILDTGSEWQKLNLQHIFARSPTKSLRFFFVEWL